MGKKGLIVILPTKWRSICGKHLESKTDWCLQSSHGRTSGVAEGITHSFFSASGKWEQSKRGGVFVRSFPIIPYLPIPRHVSIQIFYKLFRWKRWTNMWPDEEKTMKYTFIFYWIERKKPQQHCYTTLDKWEWQMKKGRGQSKRSNRILMERSTLISPQFRQDKGLTWLVECQCCGGE